MTRQDDALILDVGGRDVRVSHPGKVLFPDKGWTKLDVVEHFLACWEGALRGVRGRPTVLKRWPQGSRGRAVLPETGSEAGTCRPRVRHRALSLGAERRPPGAAHPADVIYMVQLDCLDLNPWPVARRGCRPPRRAARGSRSRPRGLVRHRAGGRPLRVGTCWWSTDSPAGRRPPARAASISSSASLRSGRSPRSAARPSPSPARSSAACPSRPRAPGGRKSVTACSSTTTRTPATGRWRARTACVRRVSCRPPSTWDEVPDVRARGLPPGHLRPERYARVGDLTAGIDEAVGRLDGLLDLARRDEQGGLGDAPWPPHFPKQGGAAARAAVRGGWPGEPDSGWHAPPPSERRGSGSPAATTSSKRGPSGRSSWSSVHCLRVLVGTPALEARGMAEAVAGQLIVAHLQRPVRVAPAPNTGPCRRSSGSAPPGAGRVRQIRSAPPSAVGAEAGAVASRR